MLKNKIIIKKIRNIFILLMAILIMVGIYHNIRNSKAENVIEIELEIADKSETLSVQTVKVDATETSDGNYLIKLPISVNENIVTKYYTSNGEEILIDSVNIENNVATIQLTEDEVANKKVQVKTDYDTKEVTADGETKLFYKKELTNSKLNENAETIDELEGNQDVTVIGYMPLDAKLEVDEIDLATLTSVKVPDEKQTFKKAYEFSIYQEVEKKENDNTSTKTEENQTIAESETTAENIEYEKVEYNPSAYEERITVKTKYDQTNEIATIYLLDDQNQTTEIGSQSVENNEKISFDTEKEDKTIRYIVATEERPEEKNEKNANGETLVPNEIKNSKWEVIESTPDIPHKKATVKIKGPVEQEKVDSVVKELVQEYEISEDKVKIIIR